VPGRRRKFQVEKERKIMSRKKEETAPTFIGVGLPTAGGNIPVTYFIGGMYTVIYVGGLHVDDVSSTDEYLGHRDHEVDLALAAHAIKTVGEIVQCWDEYKDGIIARHLEQKSMAKSAA
jgi:hypothetical protein